MRIAKIISLVTGIFFIYIWIELLIAIPGITNLYKGVKTTYNPLLIVISVLLVVFILIAANLGFLYHLIRNGKSSEKLKNPILCSIAISSISIVLYIIYVSFVANLPRP